MEANEITVKEMLDEQYRKTLDGIAEAKAGSDEAKWKLQVLTELHKERMDQLNVSLLVTKNEETKKDKVVQYVMNGASILLPIGATSYWMAKGMKFEESGTFTSRTGQWIRNHFGLFNHKK